jgi:hypothetical protein
VIPSSTKRENLASNLLARSLQLDADDMALIATLERNGREVSPDGWRRPGTDHPEKAARTVAARPMLQLFRRRNYEVSRADFPHNLQG